MGLRNRLIRLLRIPSTTDLDLDSSDAVRVRRQIILDNPYLRACYEAWYQLLAERLQRSQHLEALPIVELGCGASLIENTIPGVLKTDVIPHAYAAQVVDAQAMPFPDASVRAIVMTGVFHHMQDPAAFLSEASRVLAPGGQILMHEPSNSAIHRFMTNRFNPVEYNDPTMSGWLNTTRGNMSGANNALPWIVFVRDRETFDATFPALSLASIRYHTLLRYYVSGGLSYRPFLPRGFEWFVQAAERSIPLAPSRLGTMMLVEIERRS